MAIHRNCELSRKRKLSELYQYTSLVSLGYPPRDWHSPDEPDEQERLFLDVNDIAKGRHLDDATLPFPTVKILPLGSTKSLFSPAKSSLSSFQKPLPSPSPAAGPTLSLEEQLRAASQSPSVANDPLPTVENPAAGDATATAQRPSASTRVEAPAQRDDVIEEPTVVEEPSTTEELSVEEKAPQEVSQEAAIALDAKDDVQRETPPDGHSVDPKDAIPPTVDDTAALPETASQEAPIKEPRKARTVHLPPQEVQEARLQEPEQRLEKAAEKERKEEERLAVPNAGAPPDLVSSPSSTVGPYSQATPHAPHQSPDTSPDTETFHDAVPGPAQNEVALDPAAQQAKEEHERALQREMREARERARELSPDTPDIERQIENEQAIKLARDGKHRVSESSPAPGPRALVEHAEEVAQGVEAETVGPIVTQIVPTPAADSLPTPTTTAPEPSMVDSESTDSLLAKPPQSTPQAAEQPTPPADNDVQMDDAPLPVKEQSKAASKLQPDIPERMTTRVASGALRQKSVSEIIADKAAPKPVLTPRSSNVSAPASASASPSRPRSRDPKAKDVSTVIFAKQDASRPSRASQTYSEDYASLQGASQDSSRDYLLGLFQYQAHHPPRSAPLQELLASARKTVSTAGTLATIREAQDYKILKRVYQLQNANRWSLRQLQKSAEPARPATHMDHLLAEMKWMQTDFKEERKWKRALASTLAGWCAEYVNSTAETRASLRVKARIPHSAREGDEDMKDAPTPDLIASGANDTESEEFADDESVLSGFGSNTPARLFSLGFNDVVMKIDRTPSSDAMFQELPAYEPAYDDVTPVSFCDPPILPVSKFVTGKLVSKVRGPPRKRSRYEYESEDEPSSPPSRSGNSAEHSMPSTPGRRLFHRNDLPPEMTEVALFNPENKHVRDRLQAAHQFRPPTEFPMPSVAFFENRSASQWLWDEDQKLRSLVKEYTFNWSLVAQELSLPSIFTSGSGRRTPWECFERWVQLEGLPAEMSKTQYFRTYQTRLEQAQRTVLAQHQAQQQLMQQQAQQGQNIPGQQRRRTNNPIRVERRRENRHLAIIDGMRKLARKRESVAHKQAEAQKAAALRKAQESAPAKTTIHTPQEFSRLKWEREDKLQQQQNQLRMKNEMNRLQNQQAAAQMLQQQQQQRQANMQGQPGMPNGVNSQQRTGTPNSMGANMPTPMANSTSQQGHPNANGGMSVRAIHQQNMQGNFARADMTGMGMGGSGVPQAQMQALQNAQRMHPPEQVRMAMQKGQMPMPNQHQFQLQQQQINMASNLAQMGMNGMPNANMIAQMGGQNMNGNMNSSMSGMSGNASSPRLGQVNQAGQSPARNTLSSGHVPHLIQFQNQLKQQHPDWTQEQLTKTASEQLQRVFHRQRAMNAASGSGNMNMNGSPQVSNNAFQQNGGGMGNSPSPNPASNVQGYQAALVQQQRIMSQRQQAGSPGLNNARPVSRSATPQNPQLQQSPGMQQAQISRNQ
ncbi:hypothetical protein EJ04DRAFT_38532 [Polyplosphaeria fusca]|uniref:Vacuolar import and degradation protein 21 n=1 Tax=Polyplosphaeria fusca TaxID=682080 RepID=A0A9P4UW23_9PLEO|nr:hypothetical protein EJ04DRAFT_38532 [Polyplosphaeria fusca]